MADRLGNKIRLQHISDAIDEIFEDRRAHV